MIVFKGETADAVWREAAAKLRASGALQESRDQPIKELLHAAFSIADPRQRLVFGRVINPAFAVAEVIWILSGANASSFIQFWNPRMMNFVDDDRRRFHGAYGYRLGARPRLNESTAQELRVDDAETDTEEWLDQIRGAYEALQETPHSRQVVLQIWDSRRDLPNPDSRSKDVPCNLLSHLLLRNGRLDWFQVMRSNDLMWGTPYNFIQFTSIQEIMAGWLDVEVGTYHHVSDSLHVYERHWQELDSVVIDAVEVPRNQSDLRVASYDVWERLWSRLVDGAVQLTRLDDAKQLRSVADRLSDLPPAYVEWVALLTAEALRRRGHGADSIRMSERAGPFWGANWRQWAQVAPVRNQQRAMAD